MKAKKLPPLELLKELLAYDPVTGKLTWMDSPSKGWQWKRWVGREAGTFNMVHGKGEPAGVYVSIDAKRYAAHRIAWFLMTGEDPEVEVDHINVDPFDNRWANLRKATHSENGMNRGLQSNNTSGLKGVVYAKRSPELKKPWVAQIFKDGKRIALGYYATKGQAAVAYAKGAMRYHGQFARA